MRNDDPKLDPNRFYEIVDLPQGNAWRTPLDSKECIIGTIVRPIHPGEVKVVRGNGIRHIHTSITNAYIGIAAILRPLTQKEQAKIQQGLDMVPDQPND